MNPIAKQIREARLKIKMTEKELAKKCGVAPSYIIDIESGKKVINEMNAEKILAALGEKFGFNFGDEEEEVSRPAVKVEKKKEPVKDVYQPVEPNAQWADALTNLIKKFPIYEVGSEKVVGHKELPVLGKKVDGVAWDKVLYVKLTDSSLHNLRLYKDDVVQIQQSKEYTNKGVYYIEVGGKRLIRWLQRESNLKMALHLSLGDDEGTIIETSKVKIIGRCMKAEFHL